MVASRPTQEDGSQSRSQSQSESPSDDAYFNDLARQPSRITAPNEQQPKSKRMACVLCRRRKLRCDGAKPACATCSRLSHECVYDEVRKKSGPKRGYVKALEARLAQVETMLTQGTSSSAENDNTTRPTINTTQTDDSQTNLFPDINDMEVSNLDDFCQWAPGVGPVLSDSTSPLLSAGPIGNDSQNNRPTNDPVQDTWGALIALDIEEPLPATDMIDEFHHLYFAKVHPTSPVLHRPRYLMSIANSAPKLRPPVALQYIVFALGACASEKYESVHRHYYERARYYFERDEMRGQGEAIVSMQHVQALILIGSYEFRYLMFPRAWQTTGRTTRLALMLGLNKVDGSGMDVKQCLPPAKDLIEKEERRRAYWLCFCADRYASIGTGWPMSLDEADVMTELPASEDAFERGIYEPSITLANALRPGGASKLSPLGGVVVLACLFGRNLLHLHRPGLDENEGSLSGEFWKRHRALDDVLLNTSLAMPESLRLPMGISNPNLIFLNMCLHASTICLHQAAIFKSEKHRALAKVSAESKIRCITAAAEIASIMRLSSHQDMAGFNPFTCFCLYVSARVFVQYMKSRPSDAQAESSLSFMLAAMYAMKKKNPLAESFLIQLDVDLEAAGLDEMRGLSSETAYFADANLQGGCPIDQIMPSGYARKSPTTFGDNGLAMHTNPTVPKYTPPTSFPRLYEDSNFSGILRTSFSVSEIPVRQKTPFNGQSPRTLSPDTDCNGNSTGSGSSGQSPASTQNSNLGRISSISSINPPSMNREDPVQSYRRQNGLTTSSGFNQLAGTDHEMMFNENDTFNFDFDASNDTSFDFAQYTQLQDTFGQQKTGLTPMANVSDLGSMNDAEFDSVMNGIPSWEAAGMDQIGLAQIYRVSGNQGQE